MQIDYSSPFIKYSAKGVDFQYERLFIQTVNKYILMYKNAEYEKLTDKDKSIALARVIKMMEVNFVPVTQFFAEDLAKWSDKENFEKNLLFINLMSREIFGCYDKNRLDKNGDFYRSPYLFCVVCDGEKDYFEPPKPTSLQLKMNSLTGKNSELIEYYNVYMTLKQKEAARTLSQVKLY